jgi:hypothetical protein
MPPSWALCRPTPKKYCAIRVSFTSYSYERIVFASVISLSFLPIMRISSTYTRRYTFFSFILNTHGQALDVSKPAATRSVQVPYSGSRTNFSADDTPCLMIQAPQSLWVVSCIRRPHKFVDIYKLYKRSSVVDPGLISL